VSLNLVSKRIKSYIPTRIPELFGRRFKLYTRTLLAFIAKFGYWASVSLNYNRRRYSYTPSFWEYPRGNYLRRERLLFPRIKIFYKIVVVKFRVRSQKCNIGGKHWTRKSITECGFTSIVCTIALPYSRSQNFCVRNSEIFFKALKLVETKAKVIRVANFEVKYASPYHI
jgi:hypothetical protein